MAMPGPGNAPWRREGGWQWRCVTMAMAARPVAGPRSPRCFDGLNLHGTLPLLHSRASIAQGFTAHHVSQPTNQPSTPCKLET
ncbi:uncharacterized protein [Physcomitrium patens]|uniref:uncharacterized protein isoform X2 n=1 Tax=Physcomitrium patens TaxID=3218 RepID=UPI003CCD2BEB